MYNFTNFLMNHLDILWGPNALTERIHLIKYKQNPNTETISCIWFSDLRIFDRLLSFEVLSYSEKTLL